jgi:hypothetical protein
MILEGSGPPARHPAIPNWPGTPYQHPEGFGRSAAKARPREDASPTQGPASDKYFTETRPDKGRCVVTNLKQFIERQYGARRRSRPHAARRSVREDAGDVRVISSLGLDAATVALPAGISLDDRADRMNDFWRALVEFQYRDVVVVALCAEIES